MLKVGINIPLQGGCSDGQFMDGGGSSCAGDIHRGSTGPVPWVSPLVSISYQFLCMYVYREFNTSADIQLHKWADSHQLAELCAKVYTHTCTCHKMCHSMAQNLYDVLSMLDSCIACYTKSECMDKVHETAINLSMCKLVLVSAGVSAKVDKQF